jgi:hypothetical protein
LAFGPASGEEFGAVEAFGISGVHGGACPKTTDSVKFLAHDPVGWIYFGLPGLGEEDGDWLGGWTT